MDQQESPLFPGVKTMEQQGYKVYSSASRGFSMVAGTPKEVVDALSQAIKKTAESAELKKTMDETLQQVRYMDPTRYASLWDETESLTRPLMAEAQKESKK